MKITAERKRIDDLLTTYRSKLDTISEDRFTETPPGGGWSDAEVYSHIMQATLASMLALEKCTQKSCRPTNKGINILGRLVLMFRMFPPVRIKQPQKTAEKMPVQKLSIEEAKNMIVKCRQRLDNIAQLIHHAENDGRVAHPRLGMLNAMQWLRFIGVHLKHHIRQLERNENKFSAA